MVVPLVRVARRVSLWVFVLVLFLPSFGGEVRAIVQANTWEACDRLRKVVVRQLGGEENIRGSVSQCAVVMAPPQ